MSNAKPLSSDLVAKIRSDILIEKLPPGVKLVEQDISAHYGISRTPVREALQQLKAEGLIEIIPNRGAFVIGLTRGDLCDLFQLRKIYEIQAVRWAIERIYKEELEVLEENCEITEYYADKGDVRKIRELDEGFHGLIYEASHNRILQSVLSTYREYVSNSARIKPYDEAFLKDICEEHALIFDAFIDRNPELGAQAMERHMDLSIARAL